ncbi:MAG: hypothetical protein KGO50_11255 [Myxococcales bacterium]|jgi:hypothetical protein|nr:hypothetical protein [Myxococcales bacterium]
METQRDLVVRKANHLGLRAASFAAGTVGAVVLALTVGSPMLLMLLIGLVGVSATLVATAQWLRYRGENGLRF